MPAFHLYLFEFPANAVVVGVGADVVVFCVDQVDVGLGYLTLVLIDLGVDVVVVLL